MLKFLFYIIKLLVNDLESKYFLFCIEYILIVYKLWYPGTSYNIERTIESNLENIIFAFSFKRRIRVKELSKLIAVEPGLVKNSERNNSLLYLFNWI